MATTPYPQRPHFAFPFQRTADGTAVRVVEQDTEAEIMACEQLIARTPMGYRPDRPEFGWPWPDLKALPVDPQPLVRALNLFEPRARATAEQDAASLASAVIAGGTEEIDINVQISGSRSGR